MDARTLGYRGEDTASDFLKKRGYEILDRNFTVRGGEIDIVARDKKTLVFVEVKARSDTEYGYGDESLTRLKKHRLNGAIERYLNKHYKNSDPDCRFDVIEITGEKITHFEDEEL